MISSWDIKTLIIQTNGATETRQLPVCVGFGWYVETSLIYPSLTLRSSELKSAITLAAYSDQNVDLWGLPNTNNCIRSISSERFCNMLTLAWRLFPVKPVLHRHCSCSQNWHHSPEMLQKAEVRLSNRNPKDILVICFQIYLPSNCFHSPEQVQKCCFSENINYPTEFAKIYALKWEQSLWHISLSMGEFWLTESMDLVGWQSWSHQRTREQHVFLDTDQPAEACLLVQFGRLLPQPLLS